MTATHTRDAAHLLDAHLELIPSDSGDSARVLVIGATGNTGRHIVSRLMELGLTVRTATRGERPTDSTAEHVRFDWADPASHDEALSGVDRMYLIAPGTYFGVWQKLSTRNFGEIVGADAF